jgi:hypothetical protein
MPASAFIAEYCDGIDGRSIAIVVQSIAGAEIEHQAYFSFTTLSRITEATRLGVLSECLSPW